MDDFELSTDTRELDILRKSVQEPSSGVNMSEQKVYFALLQLHPVELDITFRSDVIGQDAVDFGSDSGLRTRVPDLDNAPIRFNSLSIEHAFGTGGNLADRVSNHYTRQLWKQLHRVLGSFDFLGNPVGFLDHIGMGVSSCFCFVKFC